jgi:hypothetical protein
LSIETAAGAPENGPTERGRALSQLGFDDNRRLPQTVKLACVPTNRLTNCDARKITPSDQMNPLLESTMLRSVTELEKYTGIHRHYQRQGYWHIKNEREAA